MKHRSLTQRISYVGGIAIGVIGLLLVVATVLGLLAWAARAAWSAAF